MFLYHISTKCSVASYANSIHGCKSVLGNDGKTYPIDKQLRQRLTNARYILFCHKKKLVCFCLPLFCSCSFVSLKENIPSMYNRTNGFESVAFIQAVHVHVVSAPTCLLFQYTWYSVLNCIVCILCCFWNSREAIF